LDDDFDRKLYIKSKRIPQVLFVFSTDKNLGPAITDRRRYVQLAFLDHLTHRSTYEKLDQSTAEKRLRKMEHQITNWKLKHKQIISDRDRTFITRTTKAKDGNGNYQFAQFYVTAKVHKRGN